MTSELTLEGGHADDSSSDDDNRRQLKNKIDNLKKNLALNGMAAGAQWRPQGMDLWRTKPRTAPPTKPHLATLSDAEVRTGKLDRLSYKRNLEMREIGEKKMLFGRFLSEEEIEVKKAELADAERRFAGDTQDVEKAEITAKEEAAADATTTEHREIHEEADQRNEKRKDDIVDEIRANGFNQLTIPELELVLKVKKQEKFDEEQNVINDKKRALETSLKQLKEEEAALRSKNGVPSSSAAASGGKRKKKVVAVAAAATEPAAGTTPEDEAEPAAATAPPAAPCGTCTCRPWSTTAPAGACPARKP